MKGDRWLPMIMGALLTVPVGWAQGGYAPSGVKSRLAGQATPAPARSGGPAAPASPPASGPGSGPAAGEEQLSPAPPSASGKRDPFRSLIITETKTEQIPSRLPPGKQGLIIGQLRLEGVVKGIDGKWIAVVANRSNRAYFLHDDDEVYSGTVSKITADSVVFAERYSDAIGQTKTREVVKTLSAE